MKSRTVLEPNLKDRSVWVSAASESKEPVVFRSHFVPSKEHFLNLVREQFQEPSLTHLQEIFYGENLMKKGEWLKKIITERGERYQKKTVLSHSSQGIKSTECEAATLEEVHNSQELQEVARFYVSRLEYVHKKSDTTLRVDWTEYEDGDDHLVVSLSSSSLHDLKRLLDLLYPNAIRSKISECLFRYQKKLYEDLVKAGMLSHVDENFVSLLVTLFTHKYHPKSIASGDVTKEQRAKTLERCLSYCPPKLTGKVCVTTAAEMEQWAEKEKLLEWIE